MSNLVDIVAERRVVACMLYGPPGLRDEARAILELFPPSHNELQQLAKGRTPTLTKGHAEKRMVEAEWPVTDTLADLGHRLWLAQSRRELMKVAMSGSEEDVRRCWAVLRHYETTPAKVVDAELENANWPEKRAYLGDDAALARVRDPYSVFNE